MEAAHARQPAWNAHLDRLRKVGVELIYGEHDFERMLARAWRSTVKHDHPPV
jgi:hypothetical protein